MAKQNEAPSDSAQGSFARWKFGKTAINEVTGRRALSPKEDAFDEDEGAEIEIETTFRRRLAGLRRLPRRERPHALRAAREWRSLTLKALRDKRATERHARHMLRKLLAPAPH